MNRKQMLGHKPLRVQNRLATGAGAAALAAAALVVPVQAAHAGGGVSIPANAPSLQSFQAASIGTNAEGYADYYKLVPLTDAAGNRVSVATASGVGAIAYLDPVGNVIVAYAWAATPVENNLASAIVAGYGPSKVPGYGDAVAFLKTAEAAGAARGIPASKFYVTGFSLGGMLASYVGSQTALPGVAFASCGIPDYQAPATTANNFISFVEASDPVAQYATDSLESASASVANPRMDHYGALIVLGTPGAEEKQFTANIATYTLPQFFSPTPPVSPTQAGVVQTEYYDLDGANHQMSLYNPDTDALAQSYGIDPTQP